jgi:beta-fructofuranosidase
MIRIERRTFMTGILGTAALTALTQGRFATAVMAEALASTLATDPRRPQFHFLPAANWMNDPNGPIYFQGEYHMFYQYNPHGAFWGDMHWGHAVSSDMVHWTHLPVALAPTPGGPDADGCFSGTAVVKDGQVIVLYTAVRAVPEAQATIKEGAHSYLETQCLATANDPELRTWTKLPAPVIATPPPELAVTGFRDPSPWRQGDWWYMVVGSGLEGKGGAVLLYRSKDLRSWEYLHILAQRNGSMALVPEHQAEREVWECPEFFALGGKHVLIYSTSGKTYWMAGSLDPQTMQFSPQDTGVLDYGSYYAPKTQLDKAGNRILWGWIPETRKQEEYKAAGWAGMMSLPRALSMGSDGRLRIGVAVEVNRLRWQEQILHAAAGDESSQRQIDALRIEGCCGEILCVARKGAEPLQLSLCDAANPEASTNAWIALKYDPLHPGQILIDDKPVPLKAPDHAALEFHLYIDGSVIEVFVNQQVACTKRFYYAGNSERSVRLQWTGKATAIERLSVWQLSPISADRLAT